jgi:hypothetical protein
MCLLRNVQLLKIAIAQKNWSTQKCQLLNMCQADVEKVTTGRQK